MTKYEPNKISRGGKIAAAGLKTFAKKVGEGLSAMAEEVEKQQQLERAERAKVELAIREYESTTGRPYEAKESVYGSVLPWDPTHPGHLVNCRPTCRDTHCLVCGDDSWGRTYCTRHRP